MFSQKQINGFLASERAGLDGIGVNDAWNVQKFGINNQLATMIRKAITDKFGMKFNWPKAIRPADLK